MSVNAINAEPQQRQGSPVASALVTGAGLGAVASTAGYFIGNKRPDLDKVFAMPKDTFETATKDAEGEVKEAVDKIAGARADYEAAGADELKTYMDKTKERATAISNTAPENAELVTNFETAKSSLTDKTVKIGDTNYTLKRVREELKTAKGAVKAAEKGTDEAAKATAKEALEKAQANYDAFKKEAKAEMEAYVKAQRALNNGRMEAYAKTDGAKTLNETIQNASKDFRSKRSAKLEDLTGKEEIKEAFAKIKKLFPKEGGTKMALIAGGIAAGVGLIAGYIMGNKTQA